MVGFFEKMMLTKKLRFLDGRIELFGERFAIVGEFISTHIMEISDEPKAIANIYRCSKESFFHFFKNVGSEYEFAETDYLKWGLDIYKFSGWGVVEYEMVDKEGKKLVVSVSDSPTGIFMKGKTNLACDHIIRGMLAGGSKAAFNSEIECLETKCIAIGDKICQFVVGPADELKSKHAALYNRQVVGSLEIGAGTVK